MWKERFTSPAWWAGALGGAKLIAASFGFELFSDAQVEAIANGAAALAGAIGVWASYGEKDKQ